MMRPRTSSGGRVDMVQPRTSSFGQDYRKRTSSFGRNDGTTGVHRTSSMSRHGHSEPHRPRTSTIGQDSFRPRTSSFGTPTSEMRPRSSSYGHQHSRYRKQRTLLQESLSSGRQHSSRHSSQESLKRSGNTSRTSQESLKSSTSMEYMDMQGGRAVGGTLNCNSSKLSSSPSHTSNLLTHDPSRKASIELKRASPSPLASSKNEENYMAMDFGEKPGTTNSYGPRRPSSGSSPSVENRRRLTLDRIDKSLSSSDHSQKVTSATGSSSGVSTGSSSKSKLSNKLKAKFHLKMPTGQSGENLKSSSESLSSGHGSDTRSRDDTITSGATAPPAGRRSSTKRPSSPVLQGVPHTPGKQYCKQYGPRLVALKISSGFDFQCCLL